jgi:hypothetical protein
MRRLGADCFVVAMKRGNACGAKEAGHRHLLGSTGNGRNPKSNGRRQPSRGGTSRMTRECQVRICEGLGVKFPGPTRHLRQRRWQRPMAGMLWTTETLTHRALGWEESRRAASALIGRRRRRVAVRPFRGICDFSHLSATSVGQSARMDPTTSPTAAAQSDDRFLLWPFFATVGPAVVFGLIAGCAPLLALLAAAVAVPPMSILAFGTLLMTVHYVRGRRWRKAVSTVVVLAYLALIPLAPRSAIGPFVGLGIWVHFLSEYPSYEAEIATLPKDAPRVRFFDWGGFAGVNEFIVYDETDAIGVPPAQRREASFEDPGVCDGPALHLMGHYYFC